MLAPKIWPGCYTRSEEMTPAQYSHACRVFIAAGARLIENCTPDRRIPHLGWSDSGFLMSYYEVPMFSTVGSIHRILPAEILKMRPIPQRGDFLALQGITRGEYVELRALFENGAIRKSIYTGASPETAEPWRFYGLTVDGTVQFSQTSDLYGPKKRRLYKNQLLEAHKASTTD